MANSTKLNSPKSKEKGAIKTIFNYVYSTTTEDTDALGR